MMSDFRHILVIGLCVWLYASTSGAASADGIQGPYVGNVTSNSAVIWWQSPEAVGGKVVVGGRSFEDRHPPFEVRIDDLEPDRPYTYHVDFFNGRRRPARGDHTFMTAPDSGSTASYRFAVLSDSRGTGPANPVNVPVLQRLVEHARSKNIRFICFPGDLIFGYSSQEGQYRRQLQLWKSALAGVMAEIPVYVTMGNHDVLLHRTRDRYGEYDLDGVVRGRRLLFAEMVFAQEFVNPVNGPANPEQPGAPPYAETSFSVTYGRDRFVFINTNYWTATRVFPRRPGDPARLYDAGNPEGRLMDGQLRWLEKVLQTARDDKVRHLFVLGHEPAFPTGHHARDAMYYEGNATLSLKRDIRRRRDKFWRLLSRNKVLAAFFGDEHNYSRGLIGPAGRIDYAPPVWQIVTGGAGARPSAQRLRHLPWADSIRVFANRYHYSLVTVDGKRAALAVFALRDISAAANTEPEFEIIDAVPDLTHRD